MDGGQKAPFSLSGVFPTTYTNIGISLQNIPTFGFDPFATLA